MEPHTEPHTAPDRETQQKGSAPREPAAWPGTQRAKWTGRSPLESWTKKELYGRASEVGIRGRSKMSKQQLIDALQEESQAHGDPAGTPRVPESPALGEGRTQGITDAVKLGEYRERLRNLRAQLVAELERSASVVAEDAANPGELSTAPTHPADSGSEGLQSEISLAQMERDKVDQIDLALRRIDSGAFGLCEDCGRTIAAERLSAVPYTRYCEYCAAGHEGGAS